MKSEWQRGASDLSGILIIVVLIFIMLTQSTEGPGSSSIKRTLLPGETAGGATITTRTGSAGSRSISKATGDGVISIGIGNARSAYQSYEEYITLENRGRTSVDITGWQLRNGKDDRPYYTGSTLQRFSADVAIIPQAARILSPNGASVLQNVILAEDERAIVTTGSFGVRSPYLITSFKENICTGYIEGRADYNFTPPLTQNCPDPEDELGIENLDPTCRDFIDDLRSCRTPKIGGKDSDGEDCAHCVNGKIVSEVCRAFIMSHYSYQGCLIHHQNDPDFEGRTWRIFLGRGWEMWAKDYESIELFDRFGQLITYKSY